MIELGNGHVLSGISQKCSNMQCFGAVTSLGPTHFRSCGGGGRPRPEMGSKKEESRGTQPSGPNMYPEKEESRGQSRPTPK